MVTLEQVLLLQKKVETAVEKIRGLSSEVAQLKADNDALRSRCAELSKALSDKTELVSALETEQDRIEATIRSALEQLDIVENSILDAAPAAASTADGDYGTETAAAEPGEEEEQVIDYSSAARAQPADEVTVQQPAPAENSLFAAAEALNAQAAAEMESAQEQAGNTPMGGEFDIF